METAFLDTLVKLASLGASGVCIFAIFWIGWLILRTAPDASPERYRTLRHFMLATIAIAIISGVTGFLNARYNAQRINELTERLGAMTTDLQNQRQLQATARGVVQTLQQVVNSKELAAAESRSEELQRDVKVLKDAMASLSSMLAQTR